MTRMAHTTLQEDHCAWLVGSTVVEGENLLGAQEKELLLRMMRDLSAIFMIYLHTFCIMTNRYYMVLSARKREVEAADREELLARYRRLCRDPDAVPPPGGSSLHNGPDAEGGIESLRRLLGDPARFMQELNQCFAQQYNRVRGRRGAFWNGHLRTLLLGNPKAQLAASAYVELSPVRAGQVLRPDAYRWCGLGAVYRGRGWREGRDVGFIHPFNRFEEGPEGCRIAGRMPPGFYRGFVALSGARSIPGNVCLSPLMVREVLALHKRLGVGNRFLGRIRHISETLALGAEEWVDTVSRKRGGKRGNGRRPGGKTEGASSGGRPCEDSRYFLSLGNGDMLASSGDDD